MAAWTKQCRRLLIGAFGKLDGVRGYRLYDRPGVRFFLSLLLHSLLIVVSLQATVLLRFEFVVPLAYQRALWRTALAALIVKNAVFHGFRLHSGMWRYTDLSDINRVLAANLVASAVLSGVVLQWWGQFLYFPRSCLILDAVFCFLGMTALRAGSRMVRELAERNVVREVRTVLVAGSCDNAGALIGTLRQQHQARQVLGILATDGTRGRRLKGVPILALFGDENIPRILTAAAPDELILVAPAVAPAMTRQVLRWCEDAGVQPVFRAVPAMNDVLDGRVAVDFLHKVEIEDILGRAPVAFDHHEVREMLRDRAVMVTGGGGSIGRELCRQIALYAPARLVIVDACEHNLYQIHRELAETHPELPLVPIVADVRHVEEVDKAIGGNRVDVLFHAAAYKHVPLMQSNPHAALSNNCLGTAHVAEACLRHGVRRMVLVSTDKAVRPTSVMGASKRMAEQIVLALPRADTSFVIVRFGNVLGSSGSVVPLFREQIARGGPVTVTSEHVTRFFMAIPEAVDLVLQAGAVGRDRDIMVLDMGEPIRIADLARNMIELSGLIPGTDVKIVYTGLKPGEKEYEELLCADENVVRTPHDRIMVMRRNENDPANGVVPVDELRALLAGGAAEHALLGFIAACVPEHQLQVASTDAGGAQGA